MSRVPPLSNFRQHSRPKGAPATLPSHVDESRRLRFVDEYIIDLDAVEAGSRVGIRPDVAKALVAMPSVQREIALAKRRRSSRTDVYADEVLRRIATLARADARDIAHVRRVNCRHCWGVYHQRQLTWAENLSRPPEEQVSLDDWDDGFDPWRDPNPDCPNCRGHGEERVWISDARDLSPGAAALYNGVKISRDGSVQVLMRDRNWAEDKLFAHLGMAPAQRHVVTISDPTKMSDAELAAAIAGVEQLARDMAMVDVTPSDGD